MTTIGTNQFFDRAQRRMSELTAHADDLQLQISTNKKVTNASDDPSGWQRLQQLSRATSDDLVWSTNIAVAQSTLGQTDNALFSVFMRLQRAQELTVQAGTGTLSEKDRTAIATELDSIVEDLNAVAATKDSRDMPLFATSGTPTSIPIGSGQSVQPTETMARAFGTGSANVMTILTTLSAALKAGGSMIAPAAAALTGIEVASANIATTRTSIGARAARVDLIDERLGAVAANREIERSSIEDVDLTAAITELQKTMTVLEATQSSFSKLSRLTLFDYLR